MTYLHVHTPKSPGMHCTTPEHWSLCYESLVTMIVESAARPTSCMVIYTENSVGDTNYTCSENFRSLLISPANLQ